MFRPSMVDWHQTDCCGGGWSNLSLDSRVYCVQCILLVWLASVGNLSMEDQMKELRLLDESSGLCGTKVLHRKRITTKNK